MRTRIDECLVEQVERYQLQYTCESCAHFDHEGVVCSLGYPEQPHRSRVLKLDQELLFCKEFELV
jgi:hypothetical protein